MTSPRLPIKLQLESLETRIVPSTTYTLPLVNDTGLNPAQESVYVLGFSTASQMVLQSNGTFAPFASSSGTIQSYDLSTIPDITFDSATPLIGARLYFFIAPPNSAPTLTYSGNGSNVTQPTNPPTSNYPPFDIVELTEPNGGGLPTVDVQTVDGFIFPLTLTLNSNLGQVGQSLTGSADRADIIAAYTAFMNAQGAAGQLYQNLVFSTNGIAGQDGGIANPGAYLASGANSSSGLNTVWNSTLTTLFDTTGRTISMIGDDGDYYQGTPTNLGTVQNPLWVIHFVGYTDSTDTTGNGNVFNIYDPQTPDPLGTYQNNETAGEMVFANDGVFNDSSGNVLIGTNSNVNVTSTQVALGLERDIVAALNRGVALLGPSGVSAGTSGGASTYWGTETNWYPAGQTENLFSLFMHTGTVNGTPIFVQPTGAVADAQGTLMGSAYGFAFDENPGHGPAGQPNVPAKFDPVPAGTTSATITLGSWFAPSPASPPPSPTTATSAQVQAVAFDALLIAAGLFADNGYAAWVGLEGYQNEIVGQPASVVSQLQAAFWQDLLIDAAILNNS